jgi:TM2 domain-containing membrane protein YozV
LDNLIARQGLSTEQQLMINSELDKKKKSKGIAFLLWVFLGTLGAHRFYLGDIGLGIGMIVVWAISWFLLFIPIVIWALIDVFLISGRVDRANNEIELDIISRVKLVTQHNQQNQHA